MIEIENFEVSNSELCLRLDIGDYETSESKYSIFYSKLKYIPYHYTLFLFYIENKSFHIST